MSAALPAALRGLDRDRTQPPQGITSVCSAHPWVIEAALRQAQADGGTALIEATCNQVNQAGGYTGLTPAAFRDLVQDLAGQVGLPRDRLVLGGDHLGPNPWRQLPAEAAMDHALALVEAYAQAGFRKLHLDCSMGCAGEPASLGDAVVAGRAAALAARAEAAASSPPVYVVGTEVPTPGGATHALDQLEPTRPEAVLATHAVHEEAFQDVAGGAAWRRVVAIVVQPGVEFGHADVVAFAPERAAGLVAALRAMPGLVFEAHSTDYQPAAALRRLVQDGFAILKVGPELTFALHRALAGLDRIAAELVPGTVPLEATMERLMLAEPAAWQGHYPGTPEEQRRLRHGSLSDRIRYYWPHPEARAAVDGLLAALHGVTIPADLRRRHLPDLAGQALAGTVDATPRSLVLAAIQDVLRRYASACG